MNEFTDITLSNDIDTLSEATETPTEGEIVLNEEIPTNQENAPEVTQIEPQGAWFDRTNEREKEILIQEEKLKSENYENALLHSDRALQYLNDRGITLETVISWGNVGYNEDDHRITFENDNSGYNMRDISGNPNIKRYKKNYGYKNGLFNGQFLYLNDIETVIITEGEIDALSVCQLNHHGIALQGADNWKELVNRCKELEYKKNFVLALDNDEKKERNTGLITTHQLQKELRLLGYEVHLFDWSRAPKGAHDVNEWLIANKKGLEKYLDEVCTFNQTDTMEEYMKEYFLHDVEENHNRKHYYTKIPSLDRHLNGIPTGVYMLASGTSCGKTTFAWQIADALATQKVNVLYFSIEQSKEELASKSLNRYLHQMDFNSKVNALDIRNKNANINYRALIDMYLKDVGGYINVIEGNFKQDFKSMSQYILQWSAQVNHEETVVFIDYLQILNYDNNEKRGITEKEKVERIIKELKSISRLTKYPIFVISSVNRASYGTEYGDGALKESGGLEYTADTVLFLQLNEMFTEAYKDGYDATNKDKKEQARKEQLKKEELKEPRSIRIYSTKNRSGKKHWYVTLNYYCEKDTFKE